MKIFVNGAPAEAAGPSLAEALTQLGYGEGKVATAINEDFVPAMLRADTMIREGDRIEVVAPRQGG